MQARVYKKLTSLVLVASILLATGPDVFGLHNCPYHDDTDQAGESHHLGASDVSPHDSRAEHRGVEATEGGAHSDGFCGWLVDCHACLETPVALNSIGAAESARVATPEFDSSTTEGPLGPRHRLFELHLPNAPPLTI